MKKAAVFCAINGAGQLLLAILFDTRWVALNFFSSGFCFALALAVVIVDRNLPS